MGPQNYLNTVTFDEEATEALLRGAETVYKAVSSTLGPKSHLVAIQHPLANPTTVGDGVTVAKAVVQYGLEDDAEDAGAKLLVMSAVATNEQVGDGTTTTVVLAYEILKAAHEAIKNGANAMTLRKGIQKAVDDICEYLDSIKKPVTDEQIKQVATVSAQNEKLGEMIADGFLRLGKNGVITVEESSGTETSIEYKEGMEFDKGYLSSYFVTNPESNEATITNPYILVTDHKIEATQDLTEFLNTFLKSVDPDQRNLVVVCDGLGVNSLATLVLNNVGQRKTMNVMAVQAPGNQDHKTDLLKDIAVSTGATFVSKEAKMQIKDVKIEDLGRSDHVTASDKSTVIVDGKSDKKEVEARIKLLTDRKDHPDTSPFDREKLTERLAKLTSGIGIISVGGNNEAEISEMRERAIDATESTKAALEDGVVAGGETGLLRSARHIGDNPDKSDEGIGYSIVAMSCYKPYEKLLANSHIEADSPTFGEDMGLDVISGKYTNLVEAGILDPVKVPKTALRNAASAAMQLLAVNTIVGVKVIKGNDTTNS